MELTTSYEKVLPHAIMSRYEIRETRNAAVILEATSSSEFRQVISVLSEFSLNIDDLVNPGGNESKVASRLNNAFRSQGWREARVDTHIKSALHVSPYRAAGESKEIVRESEVYNEGYKVDNVKGRIALDVEWNAKDGNLDRDIAAYRSLYDVGIIDGAIMITRTMDDLRSLAQKLARQAGTTNPSTRLNTTTTTNLKKLEPRMTRGDGGGCPLLAIAISAQCLDRRHAVPLAC